MFQNSLLEIFSQRNGIGDLSGAGVLSELYGTCGIVISGLYCPKHCPPLRIHAIFNGTPSSTKCFRLKGSALGYQTRQVRGKCWTILLTGLIKRTLFYCDPRIPMTTINKHTQDKYLATSKLPRLLIYLIIPV